jgi:hypothetical protein
MSTSPSSRGYARFDELAEEFAQRYRRGERPSLQKYVARLPEMAEEVRELFPALVAVEEGQGDARAEMAPPPPPVAPGGGRSAVDTVSGVIQLQESQRVTQQVRQMGLDHEPDSWPGTTDDGKLIDVSLNLLMENAHG